MNDVDPVLLEKVRTDPTLPARAFAELERRVAIALENDDGEPFSHRLTALAKRMAHNETGRQVQIELSTIARGHGPARDVVEAIALISFAQGERVDLPVSLARACRNRLATMSKPEG